MLWPTSTAGSERCASTAHTRAAQLSSDTSSTGDRSAPAPGRSNASTVWPAASSGSTSGSQLQAPPNAPWTRTNRAIGLRTFARGQDEFAPRPAGLAQLVRLRGLRQRKRPLDDDAEGVCLDELRERLQPQAVGLDEDVGDADAARREVAQAFEGRGGRHGDEEPAVAQRRKRGPAGLPADKIEDDVGVADAFLDGFAGVVDGLVGAELGQERVLGPAGGADHVGSARLGDLHRQVPDPSGGGEDQHPVARLHAGGLDERLPGREPGERERTGLDVAEPVGDPGALPRGARSVLGVSGSPKTRSPGWNLVTPRPAVSTIPATSHPTVNGGSPMKPPRARVFQSTGLTPAAAVRTRTSVGPGSGRGASSSWSTSGPPRACCRMSRIEGCCIQAEPRRRRAMTAPTQTSSAFPSPYEIATPPGCEGWQEMYPYYTLFDEARRETDEGRFWFWNSMHFPVPMPAFDVHCIDSPYQAVGEWQNRFFAVPPAMG